MNIDQFYEKLDELYARHDTAATEEYMRDSLERARAENDLGAITAIGNELAGFYRVSGKIDEAISLSQEVLRSLKDMGQETTENFASALQNGASILLVAGDKGTAMEMYLTSRKILEYRGLQQDYRMAALCNNISAAYREKNDFVRAEEEANRSIAIISALPEYRVELATSLVNLGEVQARLGKFDEAGASLERALQIYETETDGRDPHYAAAVAALGNMYYYKKQYQEAAPYFRKALGLIERDYGRNQFYEMIERNLKMVEEQSR